MKKQNKTVEYLVPVVFQKQGYVSVCATSKEDLIAKLSDPSFVKATSIPEESTYLDNTLKVDIGEGYASSKDGLTPTADISRVTALDVEAY